MGAGTQPGNQVARLSMADIVSIANASIATGINSTSITNAAVSGRLDYTTAPGGQLLVSLAAVRALAAAAGIRTTR